jgi:hypothetical protein
MNGIEAFALQGCAGCFSKCILLVWHGGAIASEQALSLL